MTDKTTDLPHLMKSLSYVPSDNRVPQALRDGADEIERLRACLIRIASAQHAEKYLRSPSGRSPEKSYDDAIQDARETLNV